ncbi:FtsX-like permease family protein [Planotetraspora thailandica]|uniref:FtsX-like permease family protein n=1 Tax=Planotetraspora thailandica TaxID=487172 RepID=UPI0027E3FD59|nr:FtsX-like permease family protein [Planotetraspora thailandica]
MRRTRTGGGRALWARLIGGEVWSLHARFLSLGAGLLLASVSFTMLLVELNHTRLTLDAGAGGPVPGSADVRVTSGSGFATDAVAAVKSLPDVGAGVAVAVLGTVDVPVATAAPRPSGAWVEVAGAPRPQWQLDDVRGPAGRPGRAPPRGAVRLLLVAATTDAVDVPTSRRPAAEVIPAIVATRDRAVAAGVLKAHSAGASTLVRRYTRPDGTVVRAPATSASPLTAPRSVAAYARVDLATLSAELPGVKVPGDAAGVLLVPEERLAELVDPSTYVGAPAAPYSWVNLDVRGDGSASVQEERARAVAERVAQRISPGAGTAILLGGRPTHAAAAVDLMGVVLAALVLVVCLVFVANATAATLRVRRRELSTLLSLGWLPGRVVRLIVGELLLVAVPAGLLAAAATAGVGWATSSGIGMTDAVTAVGVSVGLAIAGAAPSMWRVATASPLYGLHRGAPRVARWTPAKPVAQARSVGTLAVRNLARTPVRVRMGVAAIALGSGALTVVIAVSMGFGGVVAGGLFSTGVSVRSGPVDVLAGGALLLLGCIAVVDVVALDLHEQRREFATMQALGWSGARLARLVLAETTMMAAAGAVLGSSTSAALVALFVQAVPPALVLSALVAASVALAMAVVAAQVPLARTRRNPVPALLSADG